VHWGLLGAFVAALAYGVGTVLQTVGARRAERTDLVDVRLLLRLLRSLPFLAGMACDGAGFVLSLAALRSLPLFVVQAVISASLAVTALLAGLFLRAPLRGRDWLGVAVVSAGLTSLAVAAGPQHAARVNFEWRAVLLASVGGIALLAAVAGRAKGRPGLSGWTLAVLAGLCYGAAGIGARILRHPGSLRGLADDPATWAMIGAGLLGLLLYATAVQRGSVTVVTGLVVVSETLVPSAIGVVLLGDRPRHGYFALSALGFALTVAGALSLARFGELSPSEVESLPAGSGPGGSEQSPDGR
jgi:drug/metabolite transporter (DMT)-like permease